MIQYGIVGIGGFADTWVRNLRTLEREGRARLAAAVVRRPEHYAEAMAPLREAGCVFFPSLDEMLAWGREGRLDVIGVPAGISDHEPLGAQAMAAGYHVIVEKPLAATVQEVQGLYQAQERSGRRCAVHYQFIYSPTIQWLRQKLASGELGKLLDGRATIGWPRAGSYYARNSWAGQLRVGERWVLDGPATNATAHYLTNLLYLGLTTDETEIVGVRAELYRAKPIASYDTSAIEITLGNGTRLLNLVSHAVVETIDPFMDLACEHADVHWEARADSAVIRYRDGREERFADPHPGRLLVRPLDQMAAYVAGDEPEPLCGLDEASPHVLVINLAFESSCGPIPISRRHAYRVDDSDGTPLVSVGGMEQALLDAHSRGVPFSELGLPWTRPTEPVSPPYERFPQSTRLRRALGLRD